MVEHMLGPLNNQMLKFDGADPNLTRNYHQSLAQCCIDPSKILKIINQVSIQSSKKIQTLFQAELEVN